MANRSYLAVTDTDTIYPSNVEKEFKPEEQTVAQGVYCIPALWFGLFRPGDMRSREFEDHGERFTTIAPIAGIEIALTQLKAAIPKLNEMFAKQGTFDDYASLLSQAIRSTGRQYVTIEMEEIASMSDPKQFQADVREALRALNGEVSAKVGRDKLLKLSEIPSSARLPAASCLIQKQKVSDEALDVHSRIIGCAWIRKTPWE